MMSMLRIVNFLRVIEVFEGYNNKVRRIKMKNRIKFENDNDKSERI